MLLPVATRIAGHPLADESTLELDFVMIVQVFEPPLVEIVAFTTQKRTENMNSQQEARPLTSHGSRGTYPNRGGRLTLPTRLPQQSDR